MQQSGNARTHPANAEVEEIRDVTASSPQHDASVPRRLNTTTLHDSYSHYITEQPYILSLKSRPEPVHIPWHHASLPAWHAPSVTLTPACTSPIPEYARYPHLPSYRLSLDPLARLQLYSKRFLFAAYPLPPPDSSQPPRPSPPLPLPLILRRLPPLHPTQHPPSFKSTLSSLPPSPPLPSASRTSPAAAAGCSAST